VNLGLIKLGKTLADMSQKELETALGSLETAFLELPAVVTVLGLVTHPNVPDLEEYLAIFDSPVDIDLDSEQIWPAPLPITFG
jgi:electron transfer flavoprotein alpha/beta subunit